MLYAKSVKLLDGPKNFALRSPLICGLLERWPWLRDRVNRGMINQAIPAAMYRPNQFSTYESQNYTSWSSLTERTWFGRHLPAKALTTLPNAQDVADLFNRPANGFNASRKSTLLFPAFAQWFTDSFLLTNMTDRRMTTSNHEIDLCQLYGLTAVQTDQLRLKTGGLLKSQQINGEEFAEFLFTTGTKQPKKMFDKLPIPLGLFPKTPPPPPQPQHIVDKMFAFGGERANSTPLTAMMNTVFLREHNRVARLLAKSTMGWNDERLFQTARNIVIVELIKIVIEDYINHISPYCFRLRADPAVAWNAVWNKPNWIAVEFNLLYRWHSLIPDVIQWPAPGGCGAPPQKIQAMNLLFNNELLIASGLGPAMELASKQPAGHLGLLNTPEILWRTELASVNQGRTNELDTYNEYRALLGMPKAKSHEEINSDPAVAAALRKVYPNVADIEFYPGLFAEEHEKDAPLPSLLGKMVAADAFSQALTNPLLSKRVFNDDTFTRQGMSTIQSTGTLEDIVNRNVPTESGPFKVRMGQ